MYGKVLKSKRLKTKYRAWNGTEMIYPSPDLDQSLLDSETIYMAHMNDSDKDGNKIYLGDIVETVVSKEGYSDSKGNHFYRDRMGYSKITDTSHISFHGTIGEIGYGMVCYPSNVRVVGNMYENPELLDKIE